jgi:hypothetical protein
LFNDPHNEVRGAAAQVVINLRDAPLGPFQDVLAALIDSPAFFDAKAQLFITLQHAPDRVHSISAAAIKRHLNSGLASTGSGDWLVSDSGLVSALVVRGLAQTPDPEEREELLDLLDDLLRAGAHRLEATLEEVGR